MSESTKHEDEIECNSTEYDEIMKFNDLIGKKAGVSAFHRRAKGLLRSHQETDEPNERIIELLNTVLKTSRPYQLLTGYIDLLKKRSKCIKSAYVDGAHGIAIHNDAVYPIHVTTPFKGWIAENDRWAHEQEIEIGLDVARLIIDDSGRKSGIVQVLLFPAFGFTGTQQEFRIKLGKTWFSSDELVPIYIDHIWMANPEHNRSRMDREANK